jgi:hypothetical protein
MVMKSTTGSTKRKILPKLKTVTKKISEHVSIMMHSLEGAKFITPQQKVEILNRKKTSKTLN